MGEVYLLDEEEYYVYWDEKIAFPKKAGILLKNCPVCSSFFVPKPRNRVYCSTTCAKTAATRRYRSRRK